MQLGDKTMGSSRWTHTPIMQARRLITFAARGEKYNPPACPSRNTRAPDCGQVEAGLLYYWCSATGGSGLPSDTHTRASCTRLPTEDPGRSYGLIIRGLTVKVSAGSTGKHTHTTNTARLLLQNTHTHTTHNTHTHTHISLLHNRRREDYTI
jgi:hypothetical protein